MCREFVFFLFMNELVLCRVVFSNCIYRKHVTMITTTTLVVVVVDCLCCFVFRLCCSWVQVNASRVHRRRPLFPAVPRHVNNIPYCTANISANALVCRRVQNLCSCIVLEQKEESVCHSEKNNCRIDLETHLGCRFCWVFAWALHWVESFVVVHWWALSSYWLLGRW